MTQPPDQTRAGLARRDLLKVTVVSAAAGGAAFAAWPFLAQMSPSADVAAGSLEVDLRTIAPGRDRVIAWRGRPVSVRHRTPAEIAAAVDADRLPMRDPQSDSLRVPPSRKAWLIVTVACTVDQCLLLFSQGDFGGWACPCCGAQYDTSGRARRGPPDRPGRTLKNLTVPDYRFLDSHRVRFA